MLNWTPWPGRAWWPRGTGWASPRLSSGKSMGTTEQILFCARPHLLPSTSYSHLQKPGIGEGRAAVCHSQEATSGGHRAFCWESEGSPSPPFCLCFHLTLSTPSPLPSTTEWMCPLSLECSPWSRDSHASGCRSTPLPQGHLLHPPQAWSSRPDSQGQGQGEGSKALTSKFKGAPKHSTIRVSTIF